MRHSSSAVNRDAVANPIRSERELVDLLAARFPRSPLQANRTHESDAELIRLRDALEILDRGTSLGITRPVMSAGPTLAVTVDSIEEEIESGLYTDPYMIGWVACMASLSDIAATGAEPLGLLMAETLPPDFSDDDLQRLQDGIRDACGQAGTYLLGGDTNTGLALRLTGCAIGITPGPPLRRVGMSAGHLLYSTGLLGAGNAYAVVKLVGDRARLPLFNPVARIAEGRILSGFASACMDTSDGLFTTLSELMRLNGVGVDLDAGWESWLEDSAADVAENHGLPPWCMLAGQHGEYELVFSVPPAGASRVQELAGATGARPIKLGTVTARQELRMEIGGRLQVLDLPAIMNAVELARTDPIGCIRALSAIHDEIMTESWQNHDRIRRPASDIAPGRQ